MCTQELLLALRVGGAVLSPEAVILPCQCLSSPDLGHVPLGGPESPDRPCCITEVVLGCYRESVCPQVIPSPTEIAAKRLMGIFTSTQSPVGTDGSPTFVSPLHMLKPQPAMGWS